MSSTSSAYRRGAEALPEARGSMLVRRLTRRFAKKKRPLRLKDSGSPHGGWTLPMLSSNPANAHTGCFSTRATARRQRAWRCGWHGTVGRFAGRAPSPTVGSSAPAVCSTACRIASSAPGSNVVKAHWRCSKKATPIGLMPTRPKAFVSLKARAARISKCWAARSAVWRWCRPGAVAEGMRALDEVNAAVVSGEMKTWLRSAYRAAT